MTCRDVTCGKVVAHRTARAKNFLERLQGLLGKPPLEEDEALWLPRCRGIHTWGMKTLLDVIYLDKKHTVIGVFPEIPPNRFGPVFLRAASVLELSPGAIERSGIRLGDSLCFEDSPI